MSYKIVVVTDDGSEYDLDQTFKTYGAAENEAADIITNGETYIDRKLIETVFVERN